MTQEVSGTGVSGLRRFVKRPGAAPPSAPGAPGVPAARIPGMPGIRSDRSDDAPGTERCEMCRAVLGDRHGHLVDTEKRSLTCACRACYLLFTHEGAAGGRYRAVPERVFHDPGRPLTDADWNELQIPVAMAFFFYNSALDRVVAGYPSPGGATECELDLAAWDRLAAAHPLLGALAPDVEAIFVNRTGDGNEVFLLPIDECYSLVGELRMLWQGFDGGAEARAALAKFLDSLRRRALVLEGR
ncbi:MAG TPA: DUF5947 family protein [Streptosporangiaceae bacterium]|nr:DUF5947 family protein [Streptosporangiaceae bacterium]